MTIAPSRTLSSARASHRRRCAIWCRRLTLTNRGHFHPESAEFWFILLNKIRYNIEGLPVFEADQGDIVYVPKMRFHLASFAGNGPSCRLAMNGYPDLSHSYEAANAR